MCNAYRYATLAADRRKDDPNALVDALYELRVAQEDCALLIALMKERDNTFHGDAGVWMEAQRVVGEHAAKAKDQP
jgi:hypothetical protein